MRGALFLIQGNKNPRQQSIKNLEATSKTVNLLTDSPFCLYVYDMPASASPLVPLLPSGLDAF
jgi:hypothetical protein